MDRVRRRGGDSRRPSLRQRFEVRLNRCREVVRDDAVATIEAEDERVTALAGELSRDASTQPWAAELLETWGRHLGRVLLRFAVAETHLTAAAEAYRASGDGLGVVRCLVTVAELHLECHRWAEAAVVLAQLEPVAVGRDHHLAARVRLGLGRARHALEEGVAALVPMQQAVEGFERAGDALGALVARLHLAELLLWQGDVDGADAQRAAVIERAPGVDDAGTLDTWIHDVHARVLLAARRIDESLAAFARADAAASRSDDVLRDARLLFMRSAPLMALGRNADAERALSRAEPVLAAYGTPRELGLLSFNRAECRRVLGRLEESLADYDAAERLWRALGDARMLAKIVAGRANVAYAQVDLARAHDLAWQARAELEDVGRPFDVAALDFLIGLVERDRGAFARAKDTFARLAAFYDELDDPRAAECRLYEADAALELGEIPSALLAFDRAEQVFDSLGMTERLAELLNYRAEALSRLGRFDAALASVARALEVLDRAPDAPPRHRAQAYLIRSALHRERGDADAARQALHHARQQFEATGDELGLANVTARDAELEADAGRHERALERLDDAALRYRNLGYTVEIANIELRRGESWLALGDADAARAAFDRALEEFRRLGDPVGATEAHVGRARVLGARGEGLQALAEYERAARALEDMLVVQVNPLGPRSSVAFRRENLDVLSGAIGELLDAEQPTLAAIESVYHISQLFHGLGMTELLTDRGVMASPAFPADLVAERASLNASIQRAYHALEEVRASRPVLEQRPAWAARCGELVAELAQLMLRSDELEERVRMRNAVYGGLMYPDPATLARVQERLPERVALIEYVATDDQVFAFGLTRTDVTFGVLGDLGSLGAEVDVVVDTLDPGGKPRSQWSRSTLSLGAREASEALYDRVLSRLLDALGAEDLQLLLIAPDAVLTALPFEALWTGDRHLIEAYDVAYVHSGTAFVEMATDAEARADDAPGESFVGFGDPLDPARGSLVSTGESVIRTAALFATERDRRDPRTLRALADRWSTLRESDDFDEIAGEAYHVFLRGGATRAALASPVVRDATVLFIACHGIADPAAPALSALYLARGPDGDDGTIRVQELRDLGLRRAGLVVLAACETNAGSLRPFEGIAGLARAALAGGAGSVVSTLWRVPDEASSALTDTFFELRIGSGLSTARALSEAKRRAIRDGLPLAAWAGFVLWDSGS